MKEIFYGAALGFFFFLIILLAISEEAKLC